MTARLAIASLAVVIVSDVARLVSLNLPPVERYAWLALGSRYVFDVGLLSTIITFPYWLFVALRNLVRWRLRPRWGPGWAFGSWLIPVLPVLVVREAARRSGSRPGGMALVVVWFVVFLAGEVLGDVSDFSDVNPTLAVSLYIAAAALAIAVVAHITGLQMRHHAELHAMRLVPGDLVQR